MIIGYDAQELVCDNHGTGRHERLLIEAISQHHPHHRYMLYSAKVGKDTTMLTELLSQACVYLKEPHKPPLIKSMWRNGSGIIADTRRHHIGLFHGLNGTLPASIKKTNMCSIVSFYDLAAKYYPNEENTFKRIAKNRRMAASCKKADRILVASECVKHDIEKFYHVDSSKIKVVYPCYSKHYEQAIGNAEQVKTKYDLPRHFLLYTDPFTPRFNLMTVIEAFKQVDDPKLQLVVVGHRTPYYAKVKKWARENGVAHRIFRIPHMHIAHFPTLYQLAEGIIAPAHYEGFSMTMVEAMRMGTPMIASTGSCHNEIGGDAATYFNPNSPQALATAINSVFNDEKLQEKMIATGLQQSTKFSPKLIADTMIEIYKQTLQQ